MNYKEKRTFRISHDGTITGLWHDILSGINGSKHIERASTVEFDDRIQKWIVQFVGVFKHLNDDICVPVFDTRNEALAFESAKINNEIVNRGV